MLRANGRLIREALIHSHRMAGTHLFYHAGECVGRMSEELYAQADQKWIMTRDIPSSSSSRSALYICMEDLRKSRYTRAIEMAHHIKDDFEKLVKEPKTCKLLRDIIVQALSTGKHPELPESDKIYLAPQQWDEIGDVLGTALACEGKANICLGTIAMRESGDGIMSKATIAKVNEHRAVFKKCYAEAKDIKVHHDVAWHDEQLFDNEYEARFEKHYKAVERKRSLETSKSKPKPAAQKAQKEAKRKRFFDAISTTPAPEQPDQSQSSTQADSSTKV